MPNIREYRSQTSPSGPALRSGPSAESVSTGASTAMVGQAFDNLADKLNRYREEKAMNAATVKAEEWKTRSAIELQKAAESADEGFTQATHDRLEKERQAMVDQFQTDHPFTRASEAFDLHLQSAIGDRVRDAMQYESRALGAKAVVEIKNTLAAKQNRVRSDPNALQEELAGSDRVIDSTPHLSSEKKMELKSDNSYLLHDAALDAKVNRAVRDPNATVASVRALRAEMESDGSIWQKGASKGKFDTSLDTLTMAEKTLKEKQVQESLVAAKEWLNQLSEQGVDTGKFNEKWFAQNVTNPHERDQWLHNIESARAMGKEMQFVKQATTSELKSRADELRANLSVPENYDKNKAAFEAFNLAYKKRADQIESDASQLARQSSPMVDDRYKAFTQNTSPEAARVYAEASLAEQNRLGVPPSLVGKDYASGIKAQLDSVAKSETGADGVVNIFQNLANTWGDNLPVVISDLQKHKGINSNQSVALSMMTDPKKAPLAKEIVKASLISDRELGELSDEKRNDIKKEMLDAFSDLKNSVASDANGDEVLTQYTDAATALYLYRKRWDKSADVKSIADEMVNNDYKFGKTYRIPKAVNSQPVDTVSVENGVKTFLSNGLESEKLEAPTNSLGLSPEALDRTQKQSLRTFGRFVNDGENGLRFVNAKGNQVRRADGSAIRFSWDDLAALGRSGTGVPLPSNFDYLDTR